MFVVSCLVGYCIGWWVCLLGTCMFYFGLLLYLLFVIRVLLFVCLLTLRCGLIFVWVGNLASRVLVWCVCYVILVVLLVLFVGCDSVVCVSFRFGLVYCLLWLPCFWLWLLCLMIC